MLDVLSIMSLDDMLKTVRTEFWIAMEEEIMNKLSCLYDINAYVTTLTFYSRVTCIILCYFVYWAGRFFFIQLANQYERMVLGIHHEHNPKNFVRQCVDWS